MLKEDIPVIASFSSENEIIQDKTVATLGHPSETRKARNAGFVFSKWKGGDAHYVLPTIAVSELCRAHFGSDKYTLETVLDNGTTLWVAKSQFGSAIVGVIPN